MLRPALVLSLAGLAAAQDPDVAERLRVAAFASERAHDDLLFLCDRIGGRLTGTPPHVEAAGWVTDRAAQLGLRVRIGKLTMAAGWTRGPVSVKARAGDATARDLPAVAAAWTPPIAGELRGPVLVDPAPGAAVDGRIVLIAPTAVPLQPRPAGHPFRDAALVLVDGQRPFALVPTGVATWAAPFAPSIVPAAFLAADDAAWIRRQVAAGEQVELEVQGGGSLGDAPAVGDVLVELPGVGADGRKDEIVLVVVALDSWDVGTGAVADGAGVAVVLEAARLLAALDGRPQRTIRFAFLAGQAQGLGCAGYAGRLDDAAVARHVGGFAMEGGGGRLLGVALDGSERHLELAERWFEPVRALGCADVGFRPSRTGMPRALQQRGVPLFALVQEAPELAWVVGTRADVPDRTVAADLQQAACVLATGLWSLANAAEPPPRFGG